MTNDSLCTYCKHLRRRRPGRLSCDAYPEGIPETIYFNEVIHTVSVEGDHGIQFEPLEDLDERAQKDLDRLLGVLNSRTEKALEK